MLELAQRGFNVAATSMIMAQKGGMGVTSAWSPLGNFIEGQAHPNVLLILCFSHVITYGSRVFCITFQSILNRFGGKYRA